MTAPFSNTIVLSDLMDLRLHFRNYATSNIESSVPLQEAQTN